MNSKWPSFVTKDLPDTDEGDAEMHRRWEDYDREMQVIIASGIAHQDEDGWWVETATGELIGPDPEIERPWTEEDFANAKRMTFVEAFPGLADPIRKAKDEAVEQGDKDQASAEDEPPEPPRPRPPE